MSVELVLRRTQVWRAGKSESDFQRSFFWAQYNESGGTFNPDYPGVREGLMNTPMQRKMNGWSNDPDDSGGPTKYGVASRAHGMTYDQVWNLTLNQAEQIYERGYWKPTLCDLLGYETGLYVFDAACGSGPRMAIKMLQYAANVNVDGVIGPQTIQAVQNTDQLALFERMWQYRRDFYAGIAIRRPSNAKFLPGWNRRADCMTFDEMYARKSGKPFQIVSFEDEEDFGDDFEKINNYEMEGLKILWNESMELEME